MDLKNPKRELSFLGNFIKHSADEEHQQSRHGERETQRGRAVCSQRPEVEVCVYVYISLVIYCSVQCCKINIHKRTDWQKMLNDIFLIVHVFLW